jgi:L-lactate dehydrogenase complex protein LldG
MHDDRANVLGAVRAALRQGGAQAAPPAPETPDERLRGRPTGPQPALGPDRIAHFTDQLDASAATWTRARTTTEAVEAVRQVAQSSGHSELVAADHPSLRMLPWPSAVSIRFDARAQEARCAVTLAELGIAETGSLLLCASPATPTLLNFLPDVLLCLLPTDAVVGHLEDAWRWLRAHRSPLPRAVNLVTGPSRTADVEQRLQLGAHGPRLLHVVLVDSGLDASIAWRRP